MRLAEPTWRWRSAPFGAFGVMATVCVADYGGFFLANSFNPCFLKYKVRYYLINWLPHSLRRKQNHERKHRMLWTHVVFASIKFFGKGRVTNLRSSEVLWRMETQRTILRSISVMDNTKDTRWRTSNFWGMLASNPGWNMDHLVEEYRSSG